jgi:hypothetical protein
MVADYKLPGLCHLNKKTLEELAKEMKPEERVLAFLNNHPIKPNAGIFEVDETLADGEIVIKDVMTPEYDRVAKEKGRRIGKEN